MSRKQISICITLYNYEDYIIQCLESIKHKEKNYTLYEIIIVDDNSTDKSNDYVKRWTLENPQIDVKLLINEINCGPGYTLNRCIEASQGDYIFIMDADDFIINGTIIQKLLLIEENGYDIVYGEGLIYKNKNIYGYKLNKKYLNGKKCLDFFQSLVLDRISPFYLQTALIRKKFLEKVLPLSYDILSNDWQLNIKIMQGLDSIKKIGYCTTPAFAYRQHGASISLDFNKMEKLLLQVYSQLIPEKNKIKCYIDIYQKLSIQSGFHYGFRISSVFFLKIYKRSTISFIIKYLVVNLIPKKIGYFIQDLMNT